MFRVSLKEQIFRGLAVCYPISQEQVSKLWSAIWSPVSIQAKHEEQCACPTFDCADSPPATLVSKGAEYPGPKKANLSVMVGLGIPQKVQLVLFCSRQRLSGSRGTNLSRVRLKGPDERVVFSEQDKVHCTDGSSRLIS